MKENVLYKDNASDFVLEALVAICIGIILAIILIALLSIESIASKVLINIFFGAIFLFLYLKFYYKEVIIYSSEIMVIYPLNKTKTKRIKLEEVRIVKFLRRRTSGIEMIWNRKNISQKLSFRITGSDFKFAPILKHWRKNGVEIRFIPGDHELELFVAGKIDKVPITNDMIIDTTANIK
jgi:hypothetical protein